MHLHPAVAEYIDQFEQAAKQSGQYRKSIGKYERLFLQEVWGPAFQYRFDGLHAEYPFKDFKGGERFVNFVYVRNGIRLVRDRRFYDACQGHFAGRFRRSFDAAERSNPCGLACAAIFRQSGGAPGYGLSAANYAIDRALVDDRA